MKTGTVKGLVSFLLMATFPIAVNANSECPKGSAEYCYCVYEQDLQGLNTSNGNDQASIKQRMSASKKALDLCITGADNKSTDPPDTKTKSQNQRAVQEAQRRIDVAAEQEQRGRESGAEARKVMKEMLQAERLKRAEEARRKSARERLERMAEVERLKREGLAERERKELQRQADIERRKQEEKPPSFERRTPTVGGARG